MNAETLLRFFLGFIVVVMFYWMVMRPLISKLKGDRKLNKRINVLRKMGFNIETPIRDPNLSQMELELMNSNEIPTEEDIWKYYQMYCKKFEMDNKDTWTTLQPKPFEKFEKFAKTPTKRIEPEGSSDRFGFMVAGGYLFMIASTCDAMVGMPPNQVYMRYNDYASMVEMDNNQYLQELENAETE